MVLELQQAPFCLEQTNSNVHTSGSHAGSDCTSPSAPWTVLQRQTVVGVPAGILEDLLLRDPTYPPPEGFDIPERAGLDFRLNLRPGVAEGLFPLPRGSEFAGSESTLCSPSNATDRVSDSPACREHSTTHPSLPAELTTPRTASFHWHARDSSPFSALAHILGDEGAGAEDLEVVTVSPLSYWLDDDALLEAPSSPAAVDMTFGTMLHNHSDCQVGSLSGFDTSYALLTGPDVTATEGHTIFHPSPSPVSHAVSLPTASAESRHPIITSTEAPTVVVDSRPVTVQVERPLFNPLKLDHSLVSQDPRRRADVVGSLLLPPSRPETQRPALVPSSHATLDSIIASAFPLPDLPASCSPVIASPFDDASFTLVALSRPDRESSDKPRSSNRRQEAIPRRAGIELKFSSFWDEDDED
ncbi:hypothetical protein AURDEDRAFT_157038 [Auricularia subglabra TFB-10046 SS5]|nr:hypothetical protein AURDEDRAFT_157038 [Auricularia subglabra TFB-10046 SS5]